MKIKICFFKKSTRYATNVNVIETVIHNVMKMQTFKGRNWRCFLKKMFLKISQNLQENTCVRASFLIKRYRKTPVLEPFF